MLNIQKVRNIPITWFLIDILKLPYTQSNHNLLFNSPFREDKKASFSVSLEKNISIDYGTGQARDLIQIVQDYYNLANVSQALQKITDLYNNGNDSNSQTLHGNAIYSPKTTVNPILKAKRLPKLITIVKAQEIHYYPIKQYLTQKRKINLQIANKYLKEIHFTISNKQYFGLCHLNQSNGYEISGCGDKPFKTAVNKDITFFSAGHIHSTKLLIFEGIFDFLSYLSYQKAQNQITNVAEKDSLQSKDAIVLNSCSMYQKALSIIKQGKYKIIEFFLDNDSSGQDTLDRLMFFLSESFESDNLINRADLYKGYKDFNDWWVAR